MLPTLVAVFLAEGVTPHPGAPASAAHPPGQAHEAQHPKPFGAPRGQLEGLPCGDHLPMGLRPPIGLGRASTGLGGPPAGFSGTFDG